jgi:4-amino-4-deoxy-L-arabinose transferase-like glycosyltransferase
VRWDAAIPGVLLVLVGSLRIVATYPVFNHTADEPSHILCGMEWLDKGTYYLWPEQPPLCRVAAAFGPYLVGRRWENLPGFDERAIAILAGDKHYDRNLALARLGILPFFWIASLAVYLFGRRCAGVPGALAALFLFTFLPPVLAHAGLATTDMGMTAFFGLAFVAALAWLQSPGWRNALGFGAATGLALLAKLSVLAFLPAALGAALVCYLATARPSLAHIARLAGRRIPALCLAAAAACLVVWAGYRFSFGKVYFADLRLPAPEFFAGIRQVLDHNRMGHESYLLGKRSPTGFWYYYPTVLAFKTPLAFLLLVFAGIASCFTRQRRSRLSTWLPLAFSLAVLLVAANGRINIGVRHILPVYMGFSVVAAAGLLWMFALARKSKWIGLAAGMLLAWFALSSVLSHPDYLAYFNVLAGNQPENILVDSDLDWGQDVKRLAKRLRELNAPHIAFIPFMPNAEACGFPPFELNDPVKPAPGWNAVSVSNWKLNRLWLGDKHPALILWPDRFKPRERVGKSILLYYFPPAAAY